MNRLVNKLNTGWKFTRGEQPKAWYKGFDDSTWQDISLPHDWSVTEPFSKEFSSGTGYLAAGIGFYRKSFFLSDKTIGKRVFITFEGVYNHSQVWCNSYYIGKRPNGYSTFTYDITPFISYGETNVITVKVDHKDVADSRWFTGSGIYRNVFLTITEPVHIPEYGVFASTPIVSENSATVSVVTKVVNESAETANVLVKNTIVEQDGKVVQSVISTDINVSAITVGNHINESVEQTMTIIDPKLWSPDQPDLYKLVTEIIKDGEVIDSLETAIGLRWFNFHPDTGFSLNGISMKMKGVCLHHDAGCLGAAVPDKVWSKRFAQLKEMGCNSIRTSHNPPSPGFLDLCDKMGFLVMDEAFDEWEGVKNKWASGHNVYPPEHFGYYEDFPEWSERDIKTMVLRDRNHPSIILWSIGNEIDYPNDPYCHPSFAEMTGNNDSNKPAKERMYDPNKPNADRLVTVAKKLTQYVKECDTTRPVTAALAFPELSNLTGLADEVDVVGYNYKEKLYHDDHQKYPNKVIYGSENGGSPEAWQAVEDNDFISGMFAWTGIDYLGEAKGWPVRVAQSGFISLSGTKKPRFYYFQSLWQSTPMAYLSTKKKQQDSEPQHRYNLGEPHWNWELNDLLQIFCFTNCEKAELFVNGISVGSKNRSDFSNHAIQWEMPYVKGVLEVVATAKDGAICKSLLRTVESPVTVVMVADEKELYANGQDMTILHIYTTDHNGHPVFNATNEITITVEGSGALLGLENGDPQDLEPYNSNKRKIFNGSLVAYVRATSSTGKMIVHAKADGLEEVFVEIAVQ